jgi:hypothetical protein
MSIENIRAVAAENSKTKPASIGASIDKQLFGLSRVMAKAGVELNSVGKVSAAALSKKLKEAGLDAQMRITVKVALEKAGLLAD